MAIANRSRTVSLTTEMLNLPVTSGISPQGYWYYYVPVNSNNDTLGAAIKPYKFGTAVQIGDGSFTNLVMSGTSAVINESWEGSTQKYHGSSIEWIGAGQNDITQTEEADAFFFSHLGTRSTSPVDDAFYWDRAFVDINGVQWSYYQYHKHLPTLYPQFENGRQVISARGYINPTDKAFGYMINSRVTVMSTDYTSVLARIHTPSVGGAHNSHNDVTLPSVSTKNYMMGGILKGNSNRFHAFYIAANGSDWDIFTRTYTQSSLSFSAEVNLGTYNLADPTFNPVATTGTCSQYPVRAAAGSVYGSRIYFPVIFNNATSGFDLKIWSLNSLDTIAGGSLVQYTLETGVAERPDCHLKVFNDVLYAVYTDVATGGVRLKSFTEATNTWTDEGQVVTNSNTKYVRVHGFEYNSADTKFYTLLSGTSLGGGSYTGPGLYSFELTGLFSGYKHLDYDNSTNSFVVKNALAAGHISYDQIEGSLTRSSAQEPSGIPNGKNILEYVVSSPKFFNQKETILGGEEYYYQGIELRDGRKFLCGRIVGNPGNKGVDNTGDFLVTIYNDDLTDPHHIAWGGNGDDYITSCFESSSSKKVWITGYTKSELVDKKDIKVHGFCRNVNDAINQMENVDHLVDQDGNIIVVGNHIDGYITLFKYDSNYNVIWQNTYDNPSGITKAYGVALGNDDHIYVCGGTTSFGQGLEDAFVLKVRPTGRIEYVTGVGTASNEKATGIAFVQSTGTYYVVISVVSGTTTTFVTMNINGTLQSQNAVSNLVVNKIRTDTFNTNTGRFLFVGNDGAGTTSCKFGVATITGVPQIEWVRTYSNGATASNGYDIRAVNSSNYVVVGSTSTFGLILKVSYSAGIVTKQWAKTIATSTLNSVVVDAAGNSYVAGFTTASGVANMGMNDGLLAKFDSAGNISWQNAFGHDMDERLVSIDLDQSEENFIVSGWSESHSLSRDQVLFRGWTGGFGTGYYHIEGNPGVPYIYNKTTLSVAAENSSLTTISPPSNSPGSMVITGGTFVTFNGPTYTITNSGTNNYIVNGGAFTNAADPAFTLARGGTYTFVMAFGGSHPFYIKQENTVGGTSGLYNSGVTNNGATAGQTLTFAVPIDAPDTLYYRCGNHSGMGGVINIIDNPTLSNGFTGTDLQFTVNIYDGSYGKDGVFQFFLGYFDLQILQEYLNSSTHRANMAAGITLDYTSLPFKFYQVGTVGDSTADDGNIFGYDIIEGSDGTIWAVGQTSGDVSKTNSGTAGVYDYILFKFDPITETFEFYQNGSTLDEETYALTELSNGKIAYVGRTTGALGSANLGGYDIFLGIFDPATDTSTYYSTGTGLDDKGVNVHDLGSNTLAVTFTSYGALGPTNTGTEDVGVILFNYSTGTWGTAYQTGSQTSEFVEQNGKPSTLLEDGRIAVCCSTAGIFADDEVTYGFLDLGVAVLDRTTGTWSKYQYGSGASDFASSIFCRSDRLLVAGYSRATFADKGTNGIFCEIDISNGIGAKAAVV